MRELARFELILANFFDQVYAGHIAKDSALGQRLNMADSNRMAKLLSGRWTYSIIPELHQTFSIVLQLL